MPTLFEASDIIPTQSVQVLEKKRKHEDHAGRHMKPFAMFAMRPAGLRFETQTDDETVELFLRQHPVVNILWIVLTIVFLFVPVVAIPFVLKHFPFEFSIPANYLLIGTLFWYVAVFGFALSNFIHWFFNIYIVTNRRVIDIDFHYLLFKDFAEANLNRIQDLNYTTGGVLATVVDYGTVYVQTASEIPNIEFELVAHPQRIVTTIRSLMSKNGA